MVMILAGLQSIQKQLYEAAEIDGANGLKRFFHITLPMLSPTMFMVTILSLISSSIRKRHAGKLLMTIRR